MWVPSPQVLQRGRNHPKFIDNNGAIRDGFKINSVATVTGGGEVLIMEAPLPKPAFPDATHVHLNIETDGPRVDAFVDSEGMVIYLGVHGAARQFDASMKDNRDAEAAYANAQSAFEHAFHAFAHSPNRDNALTLKSATKAKAARSIEMGRAAVRLGTATVAFQDACQSADPDSAGDAAFAMRALESAVQDRE